MHKIDLNKYEVRTDLAVDLLKNNEYDEVYKVNDICISKVKLDKDNIIGKKEGLYVTIEFSDITDTEYKDIVSKVFLDEFKKFLKYTGYNKNMTALIVGLGNRKSTPDCLGSISIDKVIVTKHFFDLNINVDDNFSKVCTFLPGVVGQNGIETSDSIKAIVNNIKPDIVIIIDSLSSNTISRVNKSIQITDSGIFPGSGVGNKRKEISKDILGVPVIVIGIPTVVSASVIVCDTIKYMIKNYAYNKKLSNNKSLKLVSKSVNYEKKDVKITQEDKKTLLGLVGLLSEDELMNLTYEVLTPIGYDLMVTPKEIDFVIEKLADIISYGINHSLHNI